MREKIKSDVIPVKPSKRIVKVEGYAGMWTVESDDGKLYPGMFNKTRAKELLFHLNEIDLVYRSQIGPVEA